MTEQKTDDGIMPLTVVSVSMVGIMAVVAELSGVRVAYSTFWPIALSWLMIAFAWAYSSLRRLPGIPQCCELGLVSTSITVAVMLYSYATLRAAQPLADPWLLRIDEMAGLSVIGIVRWVDQWKWLSWLFEVSYHSLGMQLFLLPILLAIFGEKAVACRMLVGHFVACFLGCTISMSAPAVGSFHQLGVMTGDLTNLSGGMGYHFLRSFFAARSDSIFVLSVDVASGVITFPSIHAALAVLCAWAAWPVRWLRYPMLALNVAMLISTIPVGAHYGVDVVAGSLLGVVTIFICRACPESLWQRRIAFTGRTSPALASPVPN